MALIRLANVQAKIAARGFDVNTAAGREAFNDWVFECVPNCTSIAYLPDEDVLELIEQYVQSPRLSELGEVQTIDLTIW